MRLIQFAAALYGFCLAGSLALPSGSDAGSSAVLVKDSVVSCNLSTMSSQVLTSSWELDPPTRHSPHRRLNHLPHQRRGQGRQ